MSLRKTVNDLVARVNSIDDRLSVIERDHTRQLDELGSYKGRSQEELYQIQGKIISIIETLESLVSTAENQDDAERAKSLLKRARNNLTRATKAAS